MLEYTDWPDTKDEWCLTMFWIKFSGEMSKLEVWKKINIF